MKTEGAMDIGVRTVDVRLELDGETWTAEVAFARAEAGPQYDQAPAVVTRDGEQLYGVKWANSNGGEPRGWALVDNGVLWAPGVSAKPHTSFALVRLTLAVQQAVWAQRGPGRASKGKAKAVAA